MRVPRSGRTALTCCVVWTVTAGALAPVPASAGPPSPTRAEPSSAAVPTGQPGGAEAPTGTKAPTVIKATAGTRTTLAGQASWRVRGPVPSSPVSAQVALDDQGRVTLGVERAGQRILAPAPVGVRTSAADLTTGLTLLSRTERTVRDRYTMVTGRRLERQATFREVVFGFAGAGDARLDLVVRVCADGVAYRYVLGGTGDVAVTEEASAFTLPSDAPAWLLPYTPNYEAVRVETTAGGAGTGDFGFPALFAVKDTYVLLSESDVDGRYAGARLAHQTGSGTYQITLPEARVTATAPLRTPWRTAVVGDLAQVAQSTLTDDLAPPSRIADTSWIRPGTVAWSWLSENSSPRNPVRQRQYVDFAAANGWPYVLIDEGWSRDWVPGVVRYARAKGVDVLLWFHWTALDTPQERDTVLSRVAAWGVAGVKVDFMDSDAQARFQWYDDILVATAKHRLMVNFHGATIPRGIQRTWPHVMTMESVRGAENRPVQAATNTMLPFTRNVVGGMDYTPVAFLSGRDTTDAHELAEFVVFESGWQHASDRPEAYQTRPEALRTINQVPAVWDDTRLLAGHPGQEAVLARRSGDRWFVGGISALAAKTARVDLNFLGAGRYLAETVRDGDHGLVREASIVDRADNLAVPQAAKGGFVTALCRYRSNMSTCDQPVRQVPRTTLTATPDSAELRAGATLSVSAAFTLPAGEPLRDVELRLAAPAGWRVAGSPVREHRLSGGESVRATWRVTTPVSGPHGYVDLPVVATYRFLGDPANRPVHVEQAVRVFLPPADPTGTVYVSDLPLLTETNEWGPVERDSSNGEAGLGDGQPLSIRSHTYAKGLGMHAFGEVTVWLGGACGRFTAQVGVDDEVTKPGSVDFQVLGDGTALASSGVRRSADEPHTLTADVTGVRTLTLRVTDGGDGRNFDHADWGDAQLTCAAR